MNEYFTGILLLSTAQEISDRQFKTESVLVNIQCELYSSARPFRMKCSRQSPVKKKKKKSTNLHIKAKLKNNRAQNSGFRQLKNVGTISAPAAVGSSTTQPHYENTGLVRTCTKRNLNCGTVPAPTAVRSSMIQLNCENIGVGRTL
jgi:hypothetical protein